MRKMFKKKLRNQFRRTGLIDDEQNCFRLSDAHTRHARHLLQAELAEDLARFLLRTRLFRATLVGHLIAQTGGGGNLLLFFGQFALMFVLL
jgi:hypothetical protein